MRLFYPYNEILPTRKAHDVFIVQECSHLTASGLDVTLLCGSGTKDDEALFSHYNCSPFPILRLPIVRKNNVLGLSWNLPFFAASQQQIESTRPDVVISSVLKQAAYHVRRKPSGLRILYEVHELAAYPDVPHNAARLAFERTVLNQVDLITVTTEALKEILLSPPYTIERPIHVVPLATHATPLPPTHAPFALYYVGQLYKEQGLELLLEALALTKEFPLHIVGGSEQEIAPLRTRTQQLGLQNRVTFHGFRTQQELPLLLRDAGAFVAPFLATGRMPYVAHTKLVDYAAWGRPLIAPDLPVVRSHTCKETILFIPGNASSLANALEQASRFPSFSYPSTWRQRATHYKNLLTSSL